MNLNLNRFKFVRDVQQPAISGYLIMFAAAVILYFFMMQKRFADAAALASVIIAIFGLILRWRIAPILILWITAFGVIDPAFMGTINLFGFGRWDPVLYEADTELEHDLLAASLLAMLFAMYRIHAIWERVLPTDPTVRGDIKVPLPVPRPVTQIRSDELNRLLIVGGSCLVAARVYWWIITMSERAMRPHALSHGMMRAVLLLWSIGLLVVIVSSVLTYIRWNRNSPAEAAMILRDSAFHETRRETDRIERWRKWFKLKVSRRRSGR